MRHLAPLGAAALALLLALPAPAAQRSKYDWDALGAEFCRLTLAGDMAGLRPLLSNGLAADIQAAANNTELLPPNVLFQSYTNVVPDCEAHTRSAAIVESAAASPAAPRQPGPSTSSSCPRPTAPAASTTSSSPPAAATPCAAVSPI